MICPPSTTATCVASFRALDCLSAGGRRGGRGISNVRSGVGSDGMPTGSHDDSHVAYDTLPNMHPRGSGTYSKTLRIGREEDIPLMHLLAAMSYRPAKHLGATGLAAMDERGRLQVGKIADLVVFDYATITDNATYEQGTLPSTGIDYVLVSGAVTVSEGSVVNDVAAGKPIRFAARDHHTE